MVKTYAAIALAVLSAVRIASAGAGVDVVVGRYDQRGSGANLRETVLIESCVSNGKCYLVHGSVDA